MTDPSCFIAMPLTTTETARPRYGGDADHFIHVLEHLFVPAVEDAGYRPIRPIMTGSDMIPAQIINNLETADLVLCDLSDHNPNVFFELGVRTALDRPVAMVCDRISGLPFDTNTINTHRYDETIASWVIAEERARLADHIRTSGERSEGRNSLWTFFGLTQRASERMPSANPLEAKVDLLSAQIEALTRRNLSSIKEQDSATPLDPRTYPNVLMKRAASDLVEEADRLGVEMTFQFTGAYQIEVRPLTGSSAKFESVLGKIATKHGVIFHLVYATGDGKFIGMNI